MPAEVTPCDDDPINFDYPAAIAFWARRLGVTTEQLKAAVDNVGTSASRVERELHRR